MLLFNQLPRRHHSNRWVSGIVGIDSLNAPIQHSAGLVDFLQSERFRVSFALSTVSIGATQNGCDSYSNGSSSKGQIN
jgi:hypothetical protein